MNRVKTRSSTSDESSSMYNAIQQTMLVEIKSLLPALVKSAVHSELQTLITKRDELKHEISGLRTKVEGYKSQLDHWLTTVKTIENTTLPGVVQDVAALENAWKNKEKCITGKTKDLQSSQNKLQAS